MNRDVNRKRRLIIGIVLGLLFLPFTAKAKITVYFEQPKPTIYNGDVFVADIKISTSDVRINVVDGTIFYDQSRLMIKEVSTGGSILNLWPERPTFSNAKGNLKFIGGTTEGFRGENGKLLKIIFVAKNEGGAWINFLDGFSVFLSDGKGTSVNPWLKPLALNILKRPTEIPIKDEWQNLVQQDKTPPKFIETTINRDQRLFNNKYFVSFFATDKDSGIAYYKIKEGNRDFVQVESPYILKDQTLEEIIRVKAVDMAGNESIVVPILAPIPGIPYKAYVAWVIVILIVIAFIFWLWRLGIIGRTKLNNSIRK